MSVMYGGASPLEILYSIRLRTGREWRSRRAVVMWSFHRAFITSLAAACCTHWDRDNDDDETPYSNQGVSVVNSRNNKSLHQRLTGLFRQEFSDCADVPEVIEAQS